MLQKVCNLNWPVVLKNLGKFSILLAVAMSNLCKGLRISIRISKLILQLKVFLSWTIKHFNLNDNLKIREKIIIQTRLALSLMIINWNELNVQQHWNALELVIKDCVDRCTLLSNVEVKTSGGAIWDSYLIMSVFP